MNYQKYYKEKIEKRFQDIKEWPEDHKHIAGHFLHLSEFVKIEKDWFVFDAGTRDAWSCKYLEEEYGIKNCTGIEILQHYVDHWKKKGRKIIQGDICNLSNWKDGVFDLILCRHAINLTKDPEQALREFVRVSKNGGFIYIVLSIPGNKGLHYTYIKDLLAVDNWIKDLDARVLFLDKNPYRKIEYSLILKTMKGK